MFNMGSAPSLSDIAAVTKDGNGDGWGNGCLFLMSLIK
jgi:hypothetical protein